MKTPIIYETINLNDLELVLYSDPTEIHAVEMIQPDGITIFFYEYGAFYKSEFKLWKDLTHSELDKVNKFIYSKNGGVVQNDAELTDFSKRNLNVILNFLLYAGLEDQYTQTAYNYIAEDHVDGEDSEQAQLERKDKQETNKSI